MSYLQVLRTKYGLTPHELSIISGVAERTILSIEQDQDYSARIEVLIALANIFGCSVDTILGRNCFDTPCSHDSYFNSAGSNRTTSMTDRGVKQKGEMSASSSVEGSKEARYE